MLKVTKFGGSSLADAGRFAAVRDIIRSDEARRVVVVSAPGKRCAADHKITDLLYLCHAHLQYGVSCRELWDEAAQRFCAIRQALGLQLPVEAMLQETYASLSSRTPAAALASRGEYFSARLMADYLGFSFVDAADWLHFDFQGRVLEEESYGALRELAQGRSIVTPGFYGVLPSGELHTFTRGGSDVTGSLAAAALGADVYENWTDVAGVLAADPAIVSSPAPIGEMTYAELQLLSGIGTQVLHESAVSPVRQAGIPLRIRSTFSPELPGTLIGGSGEESRLPAAFFAGRRQLTLLELDARAPEETLYRSVQAALEEAGVRVFCGSCAPGRVTLLLERQPPERLHAAQEQLERLPEAENVRLRGEIGAVCAVCRRPLLPTLLLALEQAGIRAQYTADAFPLAVLAVPDSAYEPALRAAYRAVFNGS